MTTYLQNEVKPQWQYIFGDFMLRFDGTLFRKGKQLHIPPKELAVLSLLLETAGELITKETLLSRVWPDEIASDESLTRCIYTLRRILKEDREYRYIDTIYGKGYRFRIPVAMVSQQEETTQHVIAVLPFRSDTEEEQYLLHNELIQGLSKYTRMGLSVLPSSVTYDCNNIDSIEKMISQTHPEYYFTGRTIKSESGCKLFFELVRAEGHKLVYSEMFEYNEIKSITIILNDLVSVLVNKIPGLQWKSKKSNELESLDTAVVFLNGRQELSQCTPKSLLQAMKLFQHCVNANPHHSLPYCGIAECHLVLSMLGLSDPQQAFTEGWTAINEAIKIDPCNPQALGILALMSGMKKDFVVADVLFKQALSLAPSSPDIFYYHAVYQFLRKDLKSAIKTVENSLKQDPTRVSAIILKLWMLYYDSRLDEALAYSRQLLLSENYKHPVILNLVSLLFFLSGKQEKAQLVMRDSLAENRDDNTQISFLTVNKYFVQLSGNNNYQSVKSDLQKIFSKNTDIYPGLLPLLNAVCGTEEMLILWRKMKLIDCAWLNIWEQDPRIAAALKRRETSLTIAA